ARRTPWHTSGSREGRAVAAMARPTPSGVWGGEAREEAPDVERPGVHDVTDAPTGTGGGRDDEVEARGRWSKRDATEEHPLGSDRQFFDEAEPGNLRDQGSLLDEEGDDIRMYTGEPVETEQGVVLPRQQN